MGIFVREETVKDILAINEGSREQDEGSRTYGEIIWHTTLRRMCIEIS